MLTPVCGTEKTLSLLYSAQGAALHDPGDQPSQDGISTTWERLCQRVPQDGCSAMVGVDAEEVQTDGQETEELAGLPLVKEKNQRSLFAFWGRG